ncbi:MAG: transglutaminase family protein [Terriglobales bacterium]
MKASYYPLPAGDAGVRRAITWMRALAQGTEGRLNPQVRALAIAIARGQPPRDDRAQASAVFQYVKTNIEFRGEADEVLQSPLVTLQLRAGDCDDHATLIAALLGALGIKAQFVTVAGDPQQPQTFTHVYAAAWIRNPGQWLPLDTTVGRSYPGWRPELVTRVQAWAPIAGMRGLGVENVPQVPPPSPGSKTASAINLINTSGQVASSLIAAFRNTGNSANFNVMPAGGGYSGSVGVSPTMLAVGGVGAVAALALLLRRRS